MDEKLTVFRAGTKDGPSFSFSSDHGLRGNNDNNHDNDNDNDNNNNNNNNNKSFIYTGDIYQHYTTLVLIRCPVNKIYDNIVLNYILNFKDAKNCKDKTTENR